MKKLIIIFLIFFSIFYIYLLTCDEKIYYLSISNNYNSNDFSNIIAKKLKRNNLLEIHVNEFSNNNNRITDYIDMIDDNKYIIKNNKKIHFKNALIKADIITLSLGTKDFITNYGDSTEKVLTIRNNIETLIKKIREYSKEDIYFISIYSEYVDSKYIDKLNNDIKSICSDNKIKFININNNYNYITENNNELISKYVIINK
ncbi:MAG: hypothetical protein MR411_06235 [Tenericutes bacterium]|mgnify:CR=1 FL=1|nr:hypothetical protein [Mycoplasmatota bacterium]MDY3801195.1 hypothetical protein [Bacilli bacterium]